MSRDRDIRNAMAGLLSATGAFDAQPLGRPLDDYAAGAVTSNTFQLEPVSIGQRALWDSGGEDGLEVTGRVKVTITARDEDPQLRDEAAERLYLVACNALNNQQLAGVSLPAFTQFLPGARFLPPKHPERKLEATFEYRYILPSSASYDTSE